MNWQIYTAISVLALSISVVLQRILMHRDKLDPTTYAVFFQGLVSIIITIFLLIDGFRLPDLNGLWVPAIASVVLFGAGHIVYAKTLQTVEASAFSVLFATHAVWVMLMGIFLFNESLTILQIIGSLLIFASITLLVNNIRNLSFDTGVRLGLLTGLLFGLAITAWSYVGRHTDTLSWAALSFAGSALAALMFSPNVITKFKSLTTTAIFPKILLLSLFYAAGSVAMLYAYREGSFSIVSPLRQTGIIVTVLLALIILPRERNHVKQKIAAALISTLGIVLIIL